MARLEAERKVAQRAARRRRFILAAAVLALIVGLMVLFSLLGGDDDGGDDAAPATTTTTAPPKPEVTIPETPPPTTLQSTDITVGDGAEAQTGDTLKVHYVGKVYATGDEFDSSYDRDPIEVQLDPSSGIIQGWVEGLVGMKEGGRRQLIIPPDMAYGAQAKGDIPANSTLVFVIDLLSVEKAPAPAGG